MDEALKASFRAIGNFPSAPGIAQEIIALAKNPDAAIADVARTISKDPALATKLMRVANSPLYAQRRTSQNLRQAMIVVGLDATMTLCLSFSIAGSFRTSKSAGINYTSYWQRSILSALGSRCLGEALGLANLEDVFLAGLLQDLGILALDRTKAGFYGDLAKGASHEQTSAYERERLGDDHAALGAWLLSTWKFPDLLCAAVEYSHTPDAVKADSPDAPFLRCIGLGGELATAMLASARRQAVDAFSTRALKVAGLRQAQVGKLIERVAELMPDLATLFETKLLSPEEALQLTEQAQEMLAARSVQSLAEIDTLKVTNMELAERSAKAEDASRLDPLTGLSNRRRVDEFVADELAAAVAGHSALAILFLDLDRFKAINDTYGHAAGDTVLKGTAEMLGKMLRKGDLVGRIGGEEFVIVLPGGGRDNAVGLAQRLLTALRAHEHDCAGKRIRATASIGIAVHTELTPFADAPSLVQAADKAMYAAKHGGRDRFVVSGDEPDTVAAPGSPDAGSPAAHATA